MKDSIVKIIAWWIFIFVIGYFMWYIGKMGKKASKDMRL